jgi:hypothetical protein
VKQIDWSELKNEQLKAERSACFEDVQAAIEDNKVLEDIPHPNHAKYPYQRILVINIDNYAYLVPYVEDEVKMFFKTVIPSRKATKHYLGRMAK